jgi:predicted hydrocarbon binding protein
LNAIGSKCSRLGHTNEVAVQTLRPKIMNIQNSIVNRPSLGGFISIVCFKSVITGMEEALGEKATAIAMIAAGRARGKNLVKDLGLSSSNADFNTIAIQLNGAVGSAGTRLTAVDKIVQSDHLIKVYCSETVCSAGEPDGSDRISTFTMGAIWGALGELTGKKLRGVQTESVLRGGTHDVFEFSVIE